MGSHATPLGDGADNTESPSRCKGAATFSGDGRYRYWLHRHWDADLPRFAYILLNPSRADADHDDPTVRKLVALTSANGGGSFELVNLFALMDTRQVGLHRPGAVEELPGENDRWIERVVGRSDTLVLGWGDGGADDSLTRGRRAAVRRRAEEVRPLLADRRLWCFRTIKSGAPGHPGRLANNTSLRRYSGTPVDR